MMRKGAWEIIRQREASPGRWEFTLRKVESGHVTIQTFIAPSLARATVALSEAFSILLPARENGFAKPLDK